MAIILINTDRIGKSYYAKLDFYSVNQYNIEFY